MRAHLHDDVESEVHEQVHDEDREEVGREILRFHHQPIDGAKTRNQPIDGAKTRNPILFCHRKWEQEGGVHPFVQLGI